MNEVYLIKLTDNHVLCKRSRLVSCKKRKCQVTHLQLSPLCSRSCGWVQVGGKGCQGGGGGLKECDRQWADISVSDQRVEDNFMIIRCRPTHRSKLHSAVWLRYLHWFLFYFTLFHFILFYSILFYFISNDDTLVYYYMRSMSSYLLPLHDLYHR